MELDFLNSLLSINSVSGFENQAGKLFIDYIVRMSIQRIPILWGTAMPT